MTLEAKISDLATAIGTDIKDLKSKSNKYLEMLAVAANASTPVPSLGVEAIYSTLTDSILKWDGSAWRAPAAANAVLDGKVTGPASATDNTLPRFDGATGKLIQGSSVTVDDAGRVSVSATSANFANFESTHASGGYSSYINSGVTWGDIGSANQVFGSGNNSAANFGINARGSRNLVLGAGNVGSVTIDTSGNLGLGVTPSAWGGGGTTKAMELGNWTTLANSNAFGTALTFNGFYNGTNWIYKQTNSASKYESDGLHRWYVAPSGTAGNPITFTQAMTLDASGNLTVNAGSMGYGTGAGGTVTQVTSKTTAVTLNKPSGTVTMHNASLAAGASVLFGLNNTFFATTDTVVLTATAWSIFYRIETANSGTGQIGIRVTNTESVSRSDPLVFSFTIIKGATA